MNARIWQNKKSKKKLIALPWWEILDPIEDEEFNAIVKDRKVKFGALVQIGWLLENENGVWFGVNLKAAKHFKDLGEWKKK